MKQTPLGKYTVNYNIEDLVEIYKKKWLLKWIAKNHPEVIKEAEDLIRKQLENDDD